MIKTNLIAILLIPLVIGVVIINGIEEEGIKQAKEAMERVKVSVKDKQNIESIEKYLENPINVDSRFVLKPLSSDRGFGFAKMLAYKDDNIAKTTIYAKGILNGEFNSVNACLVTDKEYVELRNIEVNIINNSTLIEVLENLENDTVNITEDMPELIITANTCTNNILLSTNNTLLSASDVYTECLTDTSCFTATIVKIIDGDTIDVMMDENTIMTIRLALVNTPEIGEPLYDEAKQFTANLCSIGSTAIIDQDDKQLYDKYGRMVAKVYCSNKNLNEELLDEGLAEILIDFCNKSEFSNEEWAIKYGCSEDNNKEEENCDPSYPTVCIPPPPPDLDCGDIPYRNFIVLPPDPHRFDRDKDGIGCET